LSAAKRIIASICSGHVGVVVGGLHAEFLADVGVQLVDLLGVAETVEHDVGAGLGQGARDAQANARGRAGHEGGFAAQGFSRNSRLHGLPFWNEWPPGWRRRSLGRILIARAGKMLAGAAIHSTRALSLGNLSNHRTVGWSCM
jgi:hypothetical protein